MLGSAVPAMANIRARESTTRVQTVPLTVEVPAARDARSRSVSVPASAAVGAAGRRAAELREGGCKGGLRLFYGCSYMFTCPAIERGGNCPPPPPPPPPPANPPPFANPTPPAPHE